MQVKETLHTESVAWGSGAFLGIRKEFVQRYPQLDCERRNANKLQSIVHSTGFPSHKPLSVWLTAFEPKYKPDTAREHLFTAEDVRAWIIEVKSHNEELNNT